MLDGDCATLLNLVDWVSLMNTLSRVETGLGKVFPNWTLERVIGSCNVSI